MSELAQKLIEENKRTKAKTLDLANCGLSAIPAEVGGLFWLEALSFLVGRVDPDSGKLVRSANEGPLNEPLTGLETLRSLTGLLRLSLTAAEEIAPLEELSSLKALDLSGTQVSDVTPLASLSALQTLDLDGTQVSDVTPLASLSGLQTLYLADTQVSDVTPLASLSGLHTLNLFGTQVSDVTPLASLSALHTLNLFGTQVSDVTPLASLSGLQTLYLGNTQVSDVRPLASLSGLQTLYLGNTQVSDVRPLASFSALQTLDLSRTQVSDVRPLASLSALHTLNVNRTQVSDVTPLASLAALRTLDLSSTLVSDLSALRDLITGDRPVKWSSDSWEGPGIYVEGCPLINPPPEIVRQGNEAVLNYFAERRKGGVDQLYEAKMLIVGDGGAGKTSLLRRLYQPGQPMPMENESTKGIAIYRHNFPLKNGRTFRLNVWDFGGQEIYHATHQFFLTHRSLYVLLDDTRKDDKSVQDPGFRNWLGLVEVFGGGSPVLIFQNEKSGRSKRIDLDGIKRRYTNVKDRYEGDLANERAADRLRDAIEYYASHLSHIGEELPASWVKVRADIEELAADRPHITQQEYFEIYQRHLEFDKSKALFLSQYLHDLGVFLHFQKDLLLSSIVILQNEWATEAVFRVLDDEAVKKKLGRFDEEDCARIWQDSVYAAKHAELLALMQKFELCYELPDKAPREWLAPQLLPPGKPSELMDWNRPDDLVLRYRYEFLPKGMISRLMVRMHRFVKRPSMAWATGVLFERPATRALVELMADGKHIEIRARGTEAMGLLSAVSFDLDALNESFEGLKGKVARLAPCSCEVCTKAAAPYFFEHAALERRMEHGQATVQCEESYQNMDVVQLLYRLPGWAMREGTEPFSVVRIFLASSSELREERDAFELYLRQLNDALRKQGKYLEIVRWENFLDAMSETRLQDEYNKAVRACDVFVALFFTKAGKFTDEEFEAAWGQFKATGRPKIFTYFKNAEIKMGDARRDDLKSLWDFQDKLRGLGHYQSNYVSSEDLKLQFREQLHRVTELGGESKSRRAEA